jgi:polyhydroxyalkanoate synthase
MRKGAATLAALSENDVEIATSPKQAVCQIDKAVLYRYEPLAQRKPAKLPLLVVYSQVGRYTMLDLQPDRSVVRNLLEDGVDVYMVDWGEPNRSDRWISFDDYVADYVGGFVEHICREQGVDRVSILGVCEGGVFAACYAALNPESVGQLALAVTPIDFHADLTEDNPEVGYINRWARNLSASEIEGLIDSFGQMPGELTGLMFQEMTPVKSLTKYNWDFADAISGDREQVLNFLRMEKWLSDRPHHPGEAAKQWLIELYRENRLINKRFAIDGKVVDLANLIMPVLNIYANKDHIVPPVTSKALRDHVGTGDYQELELNVGHIGTFVSRKANRLFSETLSGWLKSRKLH